MAKSVWSDSPRSSSIALMRTDALVVIWLDRSLW
jgi:hypothetical protein